MDIDFTRMWTLGAGHTGLIVIERDDSEKTPEAYRDKFNKLVGGEFVPDEPMVFEHHMGSKPLDLIPTGCPPRYLLSDRLIQALKAGKFTGWSTYPVRVFGKDKREITGYHGFSITGKAGAVDWSRSQKIDMPFRGNMVPYTKGIYFDEKSWDGSDIFIPAITRYICIVERVYDALKSLKPTNIEFKRLSEYTSQA